MFHSINERVEQKTNKTKDFDRKTYFIILAKIIVTIISLFGSEIFITFLLRFYYFLLHSLKVLV